MPDGILSYLSFPTALIGNPGSLSLVVVACASSWRLLHHSPLEGESESQGHQPAGKPVGGDKTCPKP